MDNISLSEFTGQQASEEWKSTLKQIWIRERSRIENLAAINQDLILDALPKIIGWTLWISIGLQMMLFFYTDPGIVESVESVAPAASNPVLFQVLALFAFTFVGTAFLPKHWSVERFNPALRWWGRVLDGDENLISQRPIRHLDRYIEYKMVRDAFPTLYHSIGIDASSDLAQRACHMLGISGSDPQIKQLEQFQGMAEYGSYGFAEISCTHLSAFQGMLIWVNCANESCANQLALDQRKSIIQIQLACTEVHVQREQLTWVIFIPGFSLGWNLEQDLEAPYLPRLSKIWAIQDMIVRFHEPIELSNEFYGICAKHCDRLAIVPYEMFKRAVVAPFYGLNVQIRNRHGNAWLVSTQLFYEEKDSIPQGSAEHVEIPFLKKIERIATGTTEDFRTLGLAHKNEDNSMLFQGIVIKLQQNNDISTPIWFCNRGSELMIPKGSKTLDLGNPEIAKSFRSIGSFDPTVKEPCAPPRLVHDVFKLKSQCADLLPGMDLDGMFVGLFANATYICFDNALNYEPLCQGTEAEIVEKVHVLVSKFQQILYV